MFCDKVEVKLGDTAVIVRRATLDEMSNGGVAVLSYIFGAKSCLEPETVKFVEEHCTLADGSPVKVRELSLPQMQTLAKEIGGVPAGVPLADFITLLL